ncbi:hypothetical protein SAY87_028477 [Trapa incisa]|uniref:Uncharacterized protein n=1 Tax=Trapa incisa TaxID=236973 RepID=A0AAN7KPC6_9MYRT|nr:hypothetical protein SAY87_028477 [Trapa incisa]
MTFLDRMKTMSIELVEPGRAGAKGTAYTFFTAANARFAKELISILKGAGQKVSPELAAMGRGAPPPPGLLNLIFPFQEINGPSATMTRPRWLSGQGKGLWWSFLGLIYPSLWMGRELQNTVTLSDLMKNLRES